MSQQQRFDETQEVKTQFIISCVSIALKNAQNLTSAIKLVQYD